MQPAIAAESATFCKIKLSDQLCFVLFCPGNISYSFFLFLFFATKVTKVGLADICWGQCYKNLLDPHEIKKLKMVCDDAYMCTKLWKQYNFVQKNIVKLLMLFRCSIIVVSGNGKINVFRTSPKTPFYNIASVLHLIGYFVILTSKINWNAWPWPNLK